MTSAAEDDQKACGRASFAGKRGGGVSAGEDVEEAELGSGLVGVHGWR